MNTQKYPQFPVLIVDDEEDVLQSYKMTLHYGGISNLILCNDSRRVMTLLSAQPVSVVMLDLSMPYISGQELLVKIREAYPDLPVIVITGINNVSTAVECMKVGVFDYMVKPVEKSRLSSGIKHALEMQDLHNEVSTLSKQLLSEEIENPDAFSEIVTRNNVMRSIFKYIEVVAASPRTVLVTGESGTGKELIARAIHRLSGRDGKFVTVNVGGLDDTMFSDTLFGHHTGAFTDAKGVREGLIEKASGGTLFLDEIGDLESSSQVKLLRLLQEKEYYPLGSDIPKITDVRVVTATNADMQGRMEKGQLRKDLYYRLMTHHIRIPPLRNRLEDLPLLINHFCDFAAQSLSKERPGVPKDLVTVLASYHFPGNIRELEALVFDAVSRNSGEQLPVAYFREYIQKHTQKERSTIATPQSTDRTIFYTGEFPTLREVEDFFISEALARCKGNQLTASKLLGISQSTLSRRMKEKREEE